MVGVSAFRRSISLPKPARHSPPPPEKSLHVRSTSLPNRFHPLTAQLKHHLHALHAWHHSLGPSSSSSSAWLLAGLNRLKLLHHSFDDFLNLPQSRQSLTASNRLVDALLDRFLRFADAFGIFRAALVALREETRATQVALRSSTRRRRLGDISDCCCYYSAYLKCRRRLHKEVLLLLGVVRDIDKKAAAVVTTSGDEDQEEETEVARILMEVSLATVGVSAAVFGAVMGSSSSTSSFMGLLVRRRRKSSDEEGLIIRELEEASGDELRRLMKREEKTALRRLETLENCVAEFEKESEGVFRSLIAARVSLLNVLTR
ncbi:hypothetical protein H6P81_018994 [Aristolochia fimbriata]|uniref:Uncharacterized protein n=1 Tax=Aristolochia fimbriata TaxID=158543 RepID=A0AAV7E4U3_ARIFI|nr:hypothetical protein H6P81_018994 [Aristolochia fimbriata]